MLPPTLPHLKSGASHSAALEIGHLVGRASTPAAGLQTRPAQALACESAAVMHSKCAILWRVPQPDVPRAQKGGQRVRFVGFRMAKHEPLGECYERARVGFPPGPKPAFYRIRILHRNHSY